MTPASKKVAPIQELQNYTFISKYARWIKEENRRETWKEAVDRVRNMMLEKYANKNIDDDINWAYDMMYQKKVLGSNRILQFGGKPVFSHNVRAYNCSASYIDRLKFFQECMYILLCGAGCGYSVQKTHIDKLPPFSSTRNYCIKDKKPKTYIIDDSIEGWADSIGVLISSYFERPIFKEYEDCVVKFDYSKIRPQGSTLSSSSSPAPGPEPLIQVHIAIRKLLDGCIKNGQDRLRPIDAHDITCHIANGVLAGGIRRASLLALFSKDDEEMLQCKTGNWFVDNPQRGRANNSVALLRKETTKEDFDKIFQYIRQFGEPGIYWVDNGEIICNPCNEIGFYAYDPITKKSAFHFCNLSVVNCGNIKDVDDFYERCKASSMISTLQAGFTDFKYLGEPSENLAEAEALIGISMTGMMENPEITFNAEIQRRGAKVVKKVNREIAKKIGINIAARCTAEQPNGTGSLILQTSAGVHPHHAKRYIRRVQNNNTERPFQYFKQANKHATELSVWGSSGTDENILFPIEVPVGSKVKNQLPALEMLDLVKLTQQNWIAEGRRAELCLDPGVSNNVSNTVIVKEDEWDSVADYMYKNRKYLNGVSFISDKGDKDYQQPPFTEVLMSHEIVSAYGNYAIWTSGLIEHSMKAFNNNLWDACSFCLIDEQREEAEKSTLKDRRKARGEIAKLDFYDRMKRFADKFVDGDIRTLTYCMKDVYNWKLYCELEEEFQPVDYTKMVETQDNTKFEQEISCAGGACLI